jgi:site-specific recombinase XerD
MNNTLTVTLRKKKLNSGGYSFYLDIYHNGRRKYEFIKIKTVKPKTVRDREENKNQEALAESIRSQRYLELKHKKHGLQSLEAGNFQFIQVCTVFLNDYSKADKRVIKAAVEKLKTFLEKNNETNITLDELDENLFRSFKMYLDEQHNGETSYNYFKKIRSIIKFAIRKKYMSINPAEFVENKCDDSLKKDVLTFDELQLMVDAECPNKEVKRAFLFACLTGLRWVDIVALTWQSVKSNSLALLQSKTQTRVDVPLSEEALQLLGERAANKEKVFTLPSHTGALKSLKKWTENAKVKKKVTFHVARHSLGTNLLVTGSDITTVSQLLGHRSLKYTTRYVRVADAIKTKAIDNLPKLKLG